MDSAAPLLEAEDDRAPAVTELSALRHVINERLTRDDYKGFKFQEPALEYARDRMPVWAYDVDDPENPRSGRKSYAVCSYERMLKVMTIKRPDERRYYEILRQNYWCNLYVDLDMSKLANPGLPYRQLAADVQSALLDFLRLSYPEEKEPPRIVELDSSSEKKFSVHWYVRFSEAAFQDYRHCGAFMRRFQLFLLERDKCSSPAQSRFFGWSTEAAKEHPTPDTLAQQLVEGDYDARKNWCSMVDMHIYTMHRAFRCYGSHKGGDPVTRKLWLTEELVARNAASPYSEEASRIERSIFLSTLIQSFDSVPKRVLRCTEPDGSEPTGTSSSWDHIFPSSNRMPRRMGSVHSASGGSSKRIDPRSSDLLTELARLINREYQGANVSHPRVRVGSSTLTFPSPNTHYCTLVRREHTNNHVYFVVDLARHDWRQKCHSCGPSCSSPPQALPAEFSALCEAFLREQRDQAGQIDVSADFAFLK